MGRQIIEAGPAPEIYIQNIAGDLAIRGWEMSQLAIVADEDELEITQGEGVVYLSCTCPPLLISTLIRYPVIWLSSCSNPS